MLLTVAALEEHRLSFDMSKQQARMDRVQLYVLEQQQYLTQYKTPNASDAASVPESCRNEEPLASDAFSVSISEIVRRKQQQEQKQCQSSTAVSSFEALHDKKQTLLFPPSFVDYTTLKSNPIIFAKKKQEKRKSTPTIEKHHKRRNLLPTLPDSQEKMPPRSTPNIIKKANHGMHLLQVKYMYMHRLQKN